VALELQGVHHDLLRVVQTSTKISLVASNDIDHPDLPVNDTMLYMFDKIFVPYCSSLDILVPTKRF
jgi:hypothetical protein